jgi:transcriptional/translational regulatory protein YebC/TACO1
LTTEEKISAHIKKLGITRAEAIQLIADDIAIDKGAKLFELTPEQEKEAKKARQADRKPTTYNFPKKEKKDNTAKREIIQKLAEALTDAEDVQLVNAEREITFRANGVKYKIVLSCPRA